MVNGHRMIVIPASQINEGLRLCARNIRRFINDIRILLKDSSDWHAIALAVYAYEELAKYSELKKAKDSGQDPVSVDERLFGYGENPHLYKQEKARELIPQETMTLIEAGFDSRFFDPEFFQTEDVKVSHKLRLECAYVDWKKGKWIHGTPVIPENIRKFADAIVDALNKRESNQ